MISYDIFANHTHGSSNMLVLWIQNYIFHPRPFRISHSLHKFPAYIPSRISAYPLEIDTVRMAMGAKLFKCEKEYMQQQKNVFFFHGFSIYM